MGECGSPIFISQHAEKPWVVFCSVGLILFGGGSMDVGLVLTFRERVFCFKSM